MHPPDVLTHEPHDDELNPSNKGNDDSEGGPAGYREHSRDFGENGDDPGDERQRGNEESHVQQQSQRRIRETDDSVHGENQHFVETEFRSARGAFVTRIMDPRLFESHSAEHAAHVAVVFPECLEGVERASVDEPEIARVWRDLDRRELSKKPVKEMSRKFLEPSLTLAIFFSRHRRLGIFFQLLDHLERHFGRVLEVRIHDDHGFPASEVEAGGDRDLVTEVAG